MGENDSLNLSVGAFIQELADDELAKTYLQFCEKKADTGLEKEMVELDRLCSMYAKLGITDMYFVERDLRNEIVDRWMCENFGRGASEP